MRVIIVLIGCLFFNILSLKAQEFNFKTGDFVFQDIDCGDLCDAIEKVTPSIEGKHFSHIGLVYVAGDSIWVIEAIEKNVHLTRISTFLDHSKTENGAPKIIVGRLKKVYQFLNTKAISFALQQLGVPYDDVFLYNNGKYYCSELIFDAYKFANDGRDFFTLYPMTFKDPETNKTNKAWKGYYKKLKTKIPEGRLGCNPGSIGISETIEIVHSFY